MAFTSATITHSFINPDGSNATGTVRFSLSGRMTNGTQTLMPSQPITATLVSGALSQAITSNLDSGTVSTDSWPHWDVTIEIDGARTEEYSIQVPSGGGSVDLFSLIASQSQVE